MESTIQWSVLMFAALLLAALVVEPLAQRLRLPSSAVLVLGGFLGSEAVVAAGVDLGLRWHHFRDLVLFVLIPVLVFAAALRIEVRSFLRHLYLILILALPVFLASVFIVAAALYWGIGYPAYFPWTTALVTGALVAATDPVAVVNLLQARGAPERLSLVLEGESLLNDALAIVLFHLFVAMALQPGMGSGWAPSVVEFARVFGGGLVIGAVFGLVALGAYHLLAHAHYRTVVTLVMSYLSYLTAESLAHVSGIIAVLVVGLCLGAAVERTRTRGGEEFVAHFWEFLGFVANAFAFLLVGVTITVAMFTQMWLAMLIGIGGALLARAVGVYLLVPTATLAPRVERPSLRDRTVLGAGGVRGAMTAALALSLPVELEGWWVAQSVGYGVVVFTLFLQGPLFALGLRRMQW